MGIYVKKKKFNILNFFLIFLFLIIVLTTLYFFNIFSEKKIFDLSNIENTQFEEGPKQIIEPDFSSFIKKEDVNYKIGIADRLATKWYPTSLILKWTFLLRQNCVNLQNLKLTRAYMGVRQISL